MNSKSDNESIIDDNVRAEWRKEISERKAEREEETRTLVRKEKRSILVDALVALFYALLNGAIVYYYFLKPTCPEIGGIATTVIWSLCMFIGQWTVPVVFSIFGATLLHLSLMGFRRLRALER